MKDFGLWNDANKNRSAIVMKDGEGDEDENEEEREARRKRVRDFMMGDDDDEEN
jgi:hypothetical protein